MLIIHQLSTFTWAYGPNSWSKLETGHISNEIYPTKLTAKFAKLLFHHFEGRTSVANPHKKKKHRNDLEKKNTPNNPSVGPISCGACPEARDPSIVITRINGRK